MIRPPTLFNQIFQQTLAPWACLRRNMVSYCFDKELREETSPLLYSVPTFTLVGAGVRLSWCARRERDLSSSHYGGSTDCYRSKPEAVSGMTAVSTVRERCLCSNLMHSVGNSYRNPRLASLSLSVRIHPSHSNMLVGISLSEDPSPHIRTCW